MACPAPQYRERPVVLDEGRTFPVDLVLPDWHAGLRLREDAVDERALFISEFSSTDRVLDQEVLRHLAIFLFDGSRGGHEEDAGGLRDAQPDEAKSPGLLLCKDVFALFAVRGRPGD